MDAIDTIHLETWVNAPRSTVFDALTSQQGLDAWWGACVSAEPSEGTRVVFDHGLGDPLTMRIIALVPGEHLAWRCVSEFTDPANPASEWLGTRLLFDLRSGDGDPARGWMAPRLGVAADAELTILEFRHTGWPVPARWQAFCDAGWGTALGSLAQYCATGTAADRH